jgi:hypothetical protein
MEWTLLTISSAIGFPMASSSSFHPSLALCLTGPLSFASGSCFIRFIKLKRTWSTIFLFLPSGNLRFETVLVVLEVLTPYRLAGADHRPESRLPFLTALQFPWRNHRLPQRTFPTDRRQFSGRRSNIG